MPIDQQFIDALKYAGQQGQQLGIKSQLNDVADRANEIESTMKDEIQKRAALRSLQRTSALEVSGSGGSSQQLAAINNLVQPIPTSVNEAYITGTLTGDSQMVGVAQKMLKEDQARKLELETRKASLEIRMTESKENFALKKDAIKSGREEYQKLQGVIDQGNSYLSDLHKASTTLKTRSGGLFDTGPLDQYLNTGKDGQAIAATIGKVALDAKINFIKAAGGVQSMNSDAETAALQKTQPSMAKYADENQAELKDSASATKAILDKAKARAYSLERSGMMSGDAYISDYSSSQGQAKSGVTPLPAAHPASAYFK